MNAITVPGTSAVSGFDYASLESKTAGHVRKLATQIHRRTHDAYIENGRDLIAVKALLGHGAFGKWLKAEVAISERTAQNLMGAAAPVDAESANIAVLPVTAIYRLAAPSIPAKVRDEIIARVDSGARLTVQEISSAIADGKRREEAAHAKQKRRRQGDGERKRRQIERENEKRRQAEAKAEEAADAAVDLLREHLGGDLHTFKELLTRAGVWRVQAKLGTARP
jgi:Protein of unknown function (DUF3102)